MSEYADVFRMGVSYCIPGWGDVLTTKYILDDERSQRRGIPERLRRPGRNELKVEHIYVQRM